VGKNVSGDDSTREHREGEGPVDSLLPLQGLQAPVKRFSAALKLNF
jgi:hypothetical protein